MDSYSAGTAIDAVRHEGTTMNPLALPPERHAALYAAAARRAHELRDQAIAAALDTAIGWLRRRFGARRTHMEGVPCHS